MGNGKYGRAEQGKRVLVWTMKEHPVRRVEWGVPKMDRNVGLSFSTTTWDDVAHGLRETLASLDADSPEVSAWAKQIASCPVAGDAPGVVASTGPCPPSRALVEKLVAASGQAVKEASGVVLADTDLGRNGGQVVMPLTRGKA